MSVLFTAVKTEPRKNREPMGWGGVRAGGKGGMTPVWEGGEEWLLELKGLFLREVGERI